MGDEQRIEFFSPEAGGCECAFVGALRQLTPQISLESLSSMYARSTVERRTSRITCQDLGWGFAFQCVKQTAGSVHSEGLPTEPFLASSSRRSAHLAE